MLQSSMGHGDQGSRHVFYNSTFDEEQQEQKFMAKSQRAMMSELNQVMSQRVTQQKTRENVAIQRKYGSQAVNEMGWDVTAAAFKGYPAVLTLPDGILSKRTLIKEKVVS